MDTSSFGRITLGCALIMAGSAFAQPGSLDTGFNAAVTTGQWGLSVAVQPDGKVLAAGTFGLLRLLDNGSVDPSFSAPFSAGQTVNAVALQPDGRVLVRADVTNSAGVRLPGLIRLQANGSLDPTFQLAPGIYPQGRALALQPDGRILAGGLYRFSGPIDEQSGLFRVLADGGLDRDFDARWLNSTDPLAALALSANGTSYFTLEGYVFGIASANPDGSGNGFFDPERGYGPWGALAVQHDGKILVGQGADGEGGGFTPLRRLLLDGADDPSWLRPSMGGGDCTVRAIMVQPDGKVLFGGNNIQSVNGVQVPSLARLRTDGTLDPTFDAGNGGDGHEYYAVESLALAPDGKLVGAGWHITLPNYDPAPGIWRLNNDSGPRGIEFAAATYIAQESERVARITVRRSGAATARASVRYQVQAGTATQGRDYARSAGVVQFRPGETLKSFEIRIKADHRVEGFETVRLVLSHAIGAPLGPQSTATLTILNE